MKEPNWPLRAFAEYLLIIGGVFMASLSPWLWLPAAWFVGARLHALAIIGHWASHGIAPKWLRAFCFGPLGIDPVKYQRFHWQHHQGVGAPSDPEWQIVSEYVPRWVGVYWGDSVLDLLGLHADEGISIMWRVASPVSFITMLGVLAAVWVVLGPAALIIPAGMSTGFIFMHRWRARTEHDHLHRPGETFKQTHAPAWWKRATYLPHYTWLHAQHHALPFTGVARLIEMEEYTMK